MTAFDQAWSLMKADDVPKEGEVCGHEAEFTKRGETGYRIKYCILPKGHPADLAATDEIHIALGGHVYEETGLGEHRDAMEGME